MNKLTKLALIGLTTFGVIFLTSVGIGHYLGYAAGFKFGTPEFAEYVETSVAVGALVGLVFLAPVVGISNEMID